MSSLKVNDYQNWIMSWQVTSLNFNAARELSVLKDKAFLSGDSLHLSKETISTMLQWNYQCQRKVLWVFLSNFFYKGTRELLIWNDTTLRGGRVCRWHFSIKFFLQGHKGNINLKGHCLERWQVAGVAGGTFQSNSFYKSTREISIWNDNALRRGRWQRWQVALFNQIHSTRVQGKY